MQTLITGGRGFIGSRLVAQLEAIVIDHKDGQELLTCELPDGIDTIFHLAANVSVEESWSIPMEYMDNLRTTIRLIQRYPNARIIHASSWAAMRSKSPYGFSKKIAADYLKLFHKNYVNLVFPNIYGGGDRSVVDLWKGKDEVTIFGDGLQERDYVHVDDIVDGLLQARYWEPGEYIMGSGRRTTLLELAGDKKINFAPARKEEKEITIPNTTPDWEPKRNVFDHL